MGTMVVLPISVYSHGFAARMAGSFQYYQLWTYTAEQQIVQHERCADIMEGWQQNKSGASACSEFS